MKVLVIGPSVERTKGGMATVINSQLESNVDKQQFDLVHLVSHVEGTIGEKIRFAFKSIVYLIKCKDLGIVHIHVASDASFYRKSLLALISMFKKLPVIMHIHGCDFDDFYNRSNSLTKFWIRKILNNCKKVLVLSNYWFNFFRINIREANVEVLYNGVDIRSFKHCVATSDKVNKFLFLGRLMERKGIYDLLEAINIIVNLKQFKNINFYLAGDGDLQSVKSIIQKNNLYEYVSILGWLKIDQKRDALKEVFTVILPSYNEGLPMALLEAMASGKVIISSKVGGIPDLVEERTNGFLVTPGDIDALVEYILYVVNHQREMEHISLNNIKKIDDKFSLEKVNIHLYEIYLKVLSS